MLTKSDPDEIQSFLIDASNMQGGHAARVVFPDSIEEVCEVLARATRERTPLAVSGAGTGVVGGRVPFGGTVLATDRLNRIKEISFEGEEGGPHSHAAACGWAIAEAGVVLADFQRAVEARGMLYPPDPTERSCYLGGSVATNASGARTFKYGPTRHYIRRLKIALATGDVLDLARGAVHADKDGRIRLPLDGGRRSLLARLPSYQMPHTRKHASGYYVARGMDALDLFIGSEGTLGVICEVETTLLPKPEGVLSGGVFFKTLEDLLAFVREARDASLKTRGENKSRGAELHSMIDARALEYLDDRSLEFLSDKFPLIPGGAAGAIFFEQETTAQTEESLMALWLALLERHHALVDDSWFATSERDRAQIREFRHALPVLVNEWLAHHQQRKVSTDMAVPDAEFARILSFYRETLNASRLQYVIFGHIGDNHVHVNILPRDACEAATARDIYRRFVEEIVRAGGTISAEHGIGKLKRDYLRALYTEAHLREMAALKKNLDPACILGRGNIFPEEFLRQ
ncbi:MAG TPA: FAD-binding oxidoreductase [Pyrinomonadaceae bacterium]|jgi:D-lactate dehydrogenase (cytochrome)|nr:FAD-binding oxidoreductase [Pyrinomonadaceae bacterium]